jgi:hypothetical protein
MKAQCTAAAGTYIRGLLLLLITLMASVGKTPLEFNAADWHLILNGLWASGLPVLMRALNPKDANYGISKKE